MKSLYSLMKVQRSGSTMSNETLVARTITDWIFPGTYKCQKTVDDVAKLFVSGNAKLKPKGKNISYSEEGQSLEVLCSSLIWDFYFCTITVCVLFHIMN